VKRFVTVLSVSAMSFVALTGPAPAGPSDPPTCNGKPATFVGTPDDDVYDENTFFPPGSVIVLLGGDDRIEEFHADDSTVCAGAGRDSVGTEPLVDLGEETVLIGGRGRDFLGAGQDDGFKATGPMKLIGGAGKDHLYGGNSADRVLGGGGKDEIRVAAGDDRAWGDGGDDDLAGSYGKDRLFGGGGDDALDGDYAGQTSYTDRADGGLGTDTCQAEIQRRCEN